MEPAGAQQMWNRPANKTKLQQTECYGDGDC